MTRYITDVKGKEHWSLVESFREILITLASLQFSVTMAVLRRLFDQLNNVDGNIYRKQSLLLHESITYSEDRCNKKISKVFSEEAVTMTTRRHVDSLMVEFYCMVG